MYRFLLNDNLKYKICITIFMLMNKKENEENKKQDIPKISKNTEKTTYENTNKKRIEKIENDLKILENKINIIETALKNLEKIPDQSENKNENQK